MHWFLFTLFSISLVQANTHRHPPHSNHSRDTFDDPHDEPFHVCAHNRLKRVKRSRSPSNLFIGGNVSNQDSDYKSMRFQPIFLTYSGSESKYKYTEQQEKQARRIAARIKAFFETLVKVRRFSGAYKLNCPKVKSMCYGGHDYDKAACNTPADFYLLLRFDSEDDPCSKGASTVAHAQPCIVNADSQTQTIIGQSTMCGLKVTGEKEYDEEVYKTMIHETMHSFGFGSGGHEKWKQTVTVTHSRTYRTEMGPDQRQHMPEMKEVLQDYAGCPDLDFGPEVEDGGGSGTSGSHFEKRVFGPEIMTGITHGRQYFSQFTAAWLNSTDDFLIDMDAKINGRLLVEPLENGWFDKHSHGDGCKFFRGSCLDYINSQKSGGKSSYPYCDEKDYVPHDPTNNPSKRKVNQKCNKDHSAYYACRWGGKGQEPEEKYRYFGKGPFGSDEQSDFCTTWRPTKWAKGSSKVGDTNCQNPDNRIEGHNFMAENFGPNARCLNEDTANPSHRFFYFECAAGGTMNKARFTSSGGSACYEIECTGGRVLIRPEGKKRKLTCYGEGNLLFLSRHLTTGNKSVLARGWLKCPSCEAVCGKGKCEPDVKGITSMDKMSRCGGDFLTANILLTVATALLIKLR